MQLQEPVLQRLRQLLSAAVHASRVLSRPQHEVRVWLHRLQRFRDEQLAVVIEQSVERLQHFRRRQVQLIQDNPVSCPHGGDQGALLEHKLAG